MDIPTPRKLVRKLQNLLSDPKPSRRGLNPTSKRQKVQISTSDYQNRRGQEERDSPNANLEIEQREARILLALQALLVFLILVFFVYLWWVWSYVQSLKPPIPPPPPPEVPVLRELKWETPLREKGFQRALHEELGYTEGKHAKFAYAFYAASRDYLCGVLVNIARLKLLGADPSIELILLVPRNLLPARFLEVAQRDGLRVHEFENPPNQPEGMVYYRHSNMKMLLFNQTEYSRIVYVDSDSIILKNLDHLFLLPKQIGLAAPRSYWEDGNAKKFTSALMVIDPSQDAWLRIDAQLHPVQKDKYDMDILNDVFGRECMLLPNKYLVLNSHWEDASSGTALKNTGASDLETLASEAYVLHYTALGKPWTLNATSVETQRPNAHPFFLRSFELWFDLANKVC